MRVRTAALIPASSPWGASLLIPRSPVHLAREKETVNVFGFEGRMQLPRIAAIVFDRITESRKLRSFATGNRPIKCSCTGPGRGWSKRHSDKSSRNRGLQGSKKSWCRSFSGNLTTSLSLIEGQYRGPTPLILPTIKRRLVQTLANHFMRSWVGIGEKAGDLRKMNLSRREAEEMGIGSPLWHSICEKSRLSSKKILGGVPVLRRNKLNPKSRRQSERPWKHSLQNAPLGNCHYRNE